MSTQRIKKRAFVPHAPANVVPIDPIAPAGNKPAAGMEIKHAVPQHEQEHIQEALQAINSKQSQVLQYEGMARRVEKEVENDRRHLGMLLSLLSKDAPPSAVPYQFSPDAKYIIGVKPPAEAKSKPEAESKAESK